MVLWHQELHRAFRKSGNLTGVMLLTSDIKEVLAVNTEFYFSLPAQEH